jgi:S1-C subfamily serine protease
MTGLKGDAAKLQISAPVQPGNSGGALLDYDGAVVGVVVQKLDALRVAQMTGDIPQNVNFAIKADVAQTFLRAYGVSVSTSTATKTMLDTTEIARIGKEVTVLITCIGR